MVNVACLVKQLHWSYQATSEARIPGTNPKFYHSFAVGTCDAVDPAIALIASHFSSMIHMISPDFALTAWSPNESSSTKRRPAEPMQAATQ